MCCILKSAGFALFLTGASEPSPGGRKGPSHLVVVGKVQIRQEEGFLKVCCVDLNHVCGQQARASLPDHRSHQGTRLSCPAFCTDPLPVLGSIVFWTRVDCVLLVLK